ncbi:hypothetical protein B0H13DRAFT_2655427 [Mycena leptocephala]|nr:hypothetical protein B0H13DRAFT_2655427 [Mycena leptocephala]
MDEDSSAHNSDLEPSDEQQSVKVQNLVIPAVKTLWASVSKFPLIPDEQRGSWKKAVSSLSTLSLPTFRFAFIGTTVNGFVFCSLLFIIANDPYRLRQVHIAQRLTRCTITSYICVWVGFRVRQGIFHNLAVANRACTSAVTEISYQDSDTIEININFQSQTEWNKKLQHLLQEVSIHSDSEQSKDILNRVYPNFTDFTRVSSYDLLHAQPVQTRLGTTVTVHTQDAEACKDKLREYLVSSGNFNPGMPALWPLVRSVHIRGRFPVLASGITLVDLPGDGDIDDERNSFVGQYITKADGFVLVANAKRAQDERATHDHFRRILNQLIVDGRIVDEAVVIVATHTDDAIGDDELTLNAEETPVVENLRKDLALLSKAIRTNKTNLEHLDKSQHELAAEYRKKLAEKARLLANIRKTKVREKLNDTFVRLNSGLLPLQADKISLPIFCVASRDYLALKSALDPPAVFMDVKETEIPDLVGHICKTGECRRVRWATDFIDRAYAFSESVHGYFSEGRHPGQLLPENREKALAIIKELETSNIQEAQDVLDGIRDEIQEIERNLVNAVKKAIANAPKIVENFGRKEVIHWNTYKACMRLNGVYPPYDFNRDLTKGILPDIQSSWNLGMNNRIPLILKDAIRTIEESTDLAITNIVKVLNDRGTVFEEVIATARQTLAIESHLSSLLRDSIEAISVAQRDGTRSFKATVQNQLIQQYELVSQESGAGFWVRMKASNKEFFEQNASTYSPNPGPYRRDLAQSLGQGQRLHPRQVTRARH